MPDITLRRSAIEMAREMVARRPVYLDTETTGLDEQSEIVEISLIDSDGSVLLDTLVKPLERIPAGAT